MSKPSENFIRYPLGASLLLLAFGALVGGIYGISGAEEVPTEWLEGSPFQDYFIPSIILLVIVAGSALPAGIAVVNRHPLAGRVAFISGLITIVWISVQLTIIGYVSWMQLAVAITAVIILLFSCRLLIEEE